MVKQVMIINWDRKKETWKLEIRPNGKRELIYFTTKKGAIDSAKERAVENYKIYVFNKKVNRTK